MSEPLIEVTPAQVHETIMWDGVLAEPSGLGVQWYRKARQIRRDPTIKMVREFVVAPLLGTNWSYDEKDDAPEGAKEFVESVMEEIKLRLVRTAWLGCIDYGWQSFEKLWYDRPDGYWGLCQPKPLLHDITYILVDPANGKMAGIQQIPTTTVLGSHVLGTTPIYMSMDDAAVFNTDVEGTGWYGEPVMKALEGTFDEMTTINKSARKYDAKIAGSHWVVYYPLGTSTYLGEKNVDNGKIASNLIKGIEAVGGISVPRSVLQATDALNTQLSSTDALMWKIELLSDDGSGQAPFIDRFKYLDVLKVRAFGFPERAMLEGQFGTKAEAEAHADFGILNLEGKHRLFCCQVNEQFTRHVLRANYGPEHERCVEIKPSPLADRAKAFLQQLYTLLLQNPQGFMQEIQQLDVTGIRDKLEVPTLPAMSAYDELDQYVDPMTEPEPQPEPYEEPAGELQYG